MTRVIFTCCYAGLVVASLSGAESPATEEPHPPQQEILCSIVKDPRRYAGKTVRVTGELYIGTGGIVNNRCEAMVTKGFRWPKGLNLAPERESDVMRRELQKARDAGERKICVTVLGAIEAKRNYLVVTAPDGRQIGDGFGHLMRFLARFESSR